MAFEQQAEYNLGGGDLLANLYKAGYTGDTNQRDSMINSALSDFSGQFRNLVGRDPTAAERGAYLQNLVATTGLDAAKSGNGLELSQLTGNYIGNQYKDVADQIAQQKLQDQQGQANQLADLFRTQGNAAIDNVQNSLLDFQSKLFDKIRPNLITSLQAQGLLNSGGLNESLTGRAADLANGSAADIANLRYQNDQQANNIAFAGASAPYQYQQNQIMQTPQYLQNASSTGLQNAYNTMTQQLNFQNQAALQQQQFLQQAALNAKNTHGFWGGVGNSFATGLGTGMGGAAQGWFSPGSAGQVNQGGYTSTSPLQSLWSSPATH